MATSNSTDFTLVTTTLCDEAYDICGISSEGETISADQYARAKRSLNLIVKHRGAQGHLWTKTEGSVTLVASQATYALATLFGVKPGRVFSVRRKVTSDSIETPLAELSREEYFDSPNKASDGTPVAFYYDPQLTTGTLYLWPRPDSTTASTMTLALSYLRRIEDFDNSNDAPDLPQECLLSLCYDLAEQLALKYGVPPDIRREIAQRAAVYRAEIEAWDTEPASLFLQPDYYG